MQLCNAAAFPVQVIAPSPWQRCAAQFMKGKDGRPMLDREGKPVPVPERTWIQQNWLFLLPVGLVVRDTAPLLTQQSFMPPCSCPARRIMRQRRGLCCPCSCSLA